ncbi:hypothetical protein [Campylobacter concisus]|jgi:hypothetical protein|uniref:hypothetical protein n=1 Tax=Campylobacter concisus TaxID=199 RepID=UPI000CD83FAC|nr:hypothetical protein [Campylobacter concisus]
MAKKKEDRREKIFEEYITPEELESEFGISIELQKKYRLEDASRDKYFDKSIPRLPYIAISRNIFYEKDKIRAWLEFFRKE